jgi:hypothetical protein
LADGIPLGDMWPRRNSSERNRNSDAPSPTDATFRYRYCYVPPEMSAPTYPGRGDGRGEIGAALLGVESGPDFIPTAYLNKLNFVHRFARELSAKI